ncbi:hypothetical protein WN943_014924 [Citrus x changshan-huyou]
MGQERWQCHERGGQHRRNGRRHCSGGWFATIVSFVDYVKLVAGDLGALGTGGDHWQGEKTLAVVGDQCDIVGCSKLDEGSVKTAKFLGSLFSGVGIMIANKNLLALKSIMIL